MSHSHSLALVKARSAARARSKNVVSGGRRYAPLSPHSFSLQLAGDVQPPCLVRVGVSRLRFTASPSAEGRILGPLSALGLHTPCASEENSDWPTKRSTAKR
jgi:hypothetical protein